MEILNPRVGLMSLSVSVSVGERRRATIVDFPAASRPRKRSLSCRSFSLCFFRIVYNPILNTAKIDFFVHRPIYRTGKIQIKPGSDR